MCGSLTRMEGRFCASPSGTPSGPYGWAAPLVVLTNEMVLVLGTVLVGVFTSDVGSNDSYPMLACVDIPPWSIFWNKTITDASKVERRMSFVVDGLALALLLWPFFDTPFMAYRSDDSRSGCLA